MSDGVVGQPIIIVSGLPRSGTSLMMQMLKAGGVEILSDGNRAADPDNPQGYWEYEPVKSLRRDNSWLKLAEGKAVKVISALLPYLDLDLTYKIILMKRPLAEVIASQRKMLQRLGKGGSTASVENLEDLFARQLAQTDRWLQDPKADGGPDGTVPGRGPEAGKHCQGGGPIFGLALRHCGNARCGRAGPLSQ